jgi:hypothetical protein
MNVLLSLNNPKIVNVAEVRFFVMIYRHMLTQFELYAASSCSSSHSCTLFSIGGPAYCCYILCTTRGLCHVSAVAGYGLFRVACVM